MKKPKKSYLQRYLRYLYNKIVREKASPRYVARGWAIGMFYGCVIPFGFQLLLSIPTSFLLKGSKVGATLGTLVTNHFSIFIIYPLQCWVGAALIGARDLTYARIKQGIVAMLNTSGPVLENPTWGQRIGSWFEMDKYSALLSMGGELVAAFFVGGVLLAAVTVPVTYFTIYKTVSKYQNQRAQRLERKLAKLQRKEESVMSKLAEVKSAQNAANTAKSDQ